MGLDGSDTPVPDVLGSRKQDDTAGPPGTSGLSFEDAIGMHEDLGKVWTEARAAFDVMAAENESLSRASEQGLAVPGGAERLYRANAGFARQLDRVMSLLESEKDQIRVELLRTMYTNLCPYWQSLFIQTHMGRMQIRSPGHVHEKLVEEATALLDRVRSRV